ncbi:MAG: hypothetical protein U1F87_06190 [Kiritimatiellia bacterium]
MQNDYLNLAGNLLLDGVLKVTPRTIPGFGSPVAGDKWLLMIAAGAVTDNTLTVDPSSPPCRPGWIMRSKPTPASRASTRST